VLAAPFSGHECAYWQVDISTRSKNSWNIVHKNCSKHPFYLRDQTGVALIYPEGSECKVAFGVEEECSGLSLPDCYAEYIKSERLTMVSVLGVGQMRFRERVMQSGQPAFVLGSAMPRARAVTLSDGDEMQATGTDGPQNRIAATDHEVTAVVRRGQNEPTFIISQESARAVSTDLGIRAVAQVIGGPLLSLFGLGYWLAILESWRVSH
ncbi:MAG: GIDE domain-containing protein, partial [Gaiellaceae bacterium]